MRILHINTTTSGGAAWCVLRIAKSLEQQGEECRILVAQTATNHNVDNFIFTAEPDREYWYSNPLFAKVKHLLNRMPWYWDKEKADVLLQSKLAKFEDRPYSHHPYSCYKNIVHHPLVDWADIIHLHWVPDFVDYPSFFYSIKKPIVWTLHDMYPAIGAMHFVSDNSPIPETLLSVDKWIREVKRKAVLHCRNNMQIVAISEQMKHIIETSDVLNGFPVTLIHNGVDTDIFNISNKKSGNNVFMFSSYKIWDNRKGLNRVIKALDNLNIHKELIVVGNNSSNKRITASFPIKEVGLVTNQNELAKLYSKADFFINASYEEGFAQTPLEAMACGTPVITTPCSGATDLIRPFNGVICSGFDSEALSNGINKVLNMNYDSIKIREYIMKNYQYSIIAEQYKKLYESIAQ